MANGNTVTRNVGFAILRIGEGFTVDEVVFGGGSLPAGGENPEGMNLASIHAARSSSPPGRSRQPER